MNALAMNAYRHAALALAALICGAVHAADECSFNITGTWEAGASSSSSDPPPAARYVFGADGMVVTLTRSTDGEWSEGRHPTRYYYRLDNPRAPRLIEMRGPDGAALRGSMKVTQFDDASFTTTDPSSVAMRWTRVDPERHFISFTAVKGDVARGGASFVTLIATDAEGRPHWESFGIYLTENLPIVGPIPAELTRKLMTESRLDTETMLRVELTASEYTRALAVMQTWERRAREQTLLYEVPYLNSIVFVGQMAESLDRCSERIKVKKVGWNVGDITASHNLPQMPFYYIRELRHDNDTLHLGNEQFRQRLNGLCLACKPPAAASTGAAPVRR